MQEGYIKMKRRHKKNKFRFNQSPVDTNKTGREQMNPMTNKKFKENANTDENNSLIDQKLWQVAELLMPSNVAKERITIRIDTDILEWLKKQGKGYQSKINSILRTFMKTDQKYRHSNYKHAHQDRRL